MSLKTEDSWNSDLRDTSRAASALALTGTVYPEVGKWLLDRQKDGSWNEDVYDSTYALTALADMGHYNEEACRWLIDNYGEKWEHPGTTSLIITALFKTGKNKGKNEYRDFIRERAEWILSQRENGSAWKTPATSNLVIQSLVLAGYKEDCLEPLKWVLSKMNSNASWGKDNGDINTTSLTLITIRSFQK
ncbi:MAG: hypothetical protein R2741_05015 [Methanolobus sp.]